MSVATRFEYRKAVRAHWRPSASRRAPDPDHIAGLMPSGWFLEGAAWLVIGERAAGDRLVLDQAPTWEVAQERAQRLREHLEGYERIVIEPQDNDRGQEDR